MRKENSNWLGHLLGDDRPSVFQGMGYHIADFVIGILDRLKERRKEQEEEYNNYLNTRLNMVDQTRADYEWENNHLRQQIAAARQEIQTLLDQPIEIDQEKFLMQFVEQREEVEEEDE